MFRHTQNLDILSQGDHFCNSIRILVFGSFKIQSNTYICSCNPIFVTSVPYDLVVWIFTAKIFRKNATGPTESEYFLTIRRIYLLNGSKINPVTVKMTLKRFQSYWNPCCENLDQNLSSNDALLILVLYILYKYGKKNKFRHVARAYFYNTTLINMENKMISSLALRDILALVS